MVKHDSTEKSPATPAVAERSETKYKGVRKRKWGKYVSEIRLPNSRERIWLGSFDSAKKAARAFDAALFCLRGNSASFNFPDNPPNISGGQSLTPAEIQSAAHQFANSDPTTSSTTTFSCSSSGSETEAYHPDSPSVSDGTARPVHDSDPNPSNILNLFATMGPLDDDMSYNNPTAPSNQSYEIFPGFDDLRNDFFLSPPPPFPSVEDSYNNNEYESSSNGFYLWDF
ncbi:ethylene-responsive transcription factor ERF017-like [Impatiens glandulifera]|uniref:ethylene-responsive transcription factor ERF017-like n=1 Tax=Impatiens glandulifera TaxID=253017 RepID=UPI001FB09634|nr:ethylene-responsive transcription factor ERF017-like [Impatiens glandulifera]